MGPLEMTKDLILGIESSCDDTSLAIIQTFPDHSPHKDEQLIAHQSFSQTDMLAKWGGVVPELAARMHLDKLPLLLKSVSAEAGLDPSSKDFISDLKKRLKMIAVTTSPGLLGPLLTGLNTAKALSMILECPIAPVNHLMAHLEAVFLDSSPETSPTYPYLGIMISGGHTLFLLVPSCRWEDCTLLGSTIDDAAGEAFDKGGKLLGLGYPAGAKIDQLAQQGDSNRYQFPIGLKQSANAQLSYSGLKTSLRLHIEKHGAPEISPPSQELFDVCASYQKAIIEAVILKLRYALAKCPPRIPIVVGGGVAMNSGLRLRLQEKYGQKHSLYFVHPKFCQDNGAMIAHLGNRDPQLLVPFPECLELDAQSRVIDKLQQIQ